jgi:hypothetical protein
MFLHSLLNALVQITNKMELQKESAVAITKVTVSNLIWCYLPSTDVTNITDAGRYPRTVRAWLWVSCPN